MNKSETIGNLAKSLCAVQSKLQPAIKDSNNPFFKSKYADLNSVWDSCRELLTENGLAVSQLNEVSENGVIVETVLMHESGEWISGQIFLPLAKHDPQGVGSAITYGRRYGLAAALGIVADIDDDGNAASQPKQQQRTQQPPQQKPPIDLNDSIIKAKQELLKLDVKAEPRKQNESEREYLDGLREQYKQRKAFLNN